MRDDYRIRQLRRDLRKFLPQRSDDLEALPRLVALGYPAVEPVLFDLLKWIRNPDWPVAKPVAAFLRELGPRLTPAIEQMFRTDDRSWAALAIREILEHWPAEALQPLFAQLEQQAIHAHFGYDLEALSLLVRKRLIPREDARELLQRKRSFLQTELFQVEAIEDLLSDPAV
jgi:hypothetical protein